MIKEFTPQGKNKEILDRAMAHIKSVAYRVSLRWLFYRLLQSKLYTSKKDYHKKWKGLCSLVRKRSYAEWRPDTLHDDTSEMIERVGLFQDRKHLEESPDVVADMIEITFDPFYEMDRYTVIGFEARAMVEQFMHYTEGINLFPFGGDAHIEPKWKVAKHLEDAYRWYGGIPIQFLYFGDYDNKGNKIFNSAKKDIQKWCKYPIDFVWCGLTEEQIKEFSLPEDVEAKEPGQYQWEALTDPQAKLIIERAFGSLRSRYQTHQKEDQGGENGHGGISKDNQEGVEKMTMKIKIIEMMMGGPSRKGSSEVSWPRISPSPPTRRGHDKGQMDRI